MKKKYEFFRYIMRYKVQYSILCLAYAGVVISQLLIPKFLSEMTAGLGIMSQNVFLQWVVLFCGVIILEMSGTYLFGHYNYKLSNMAVVGAEADAVEMLIHTEYESLLKQNSSYLVQIVHNDIVYVMDFFVEKIPLLVLQFGEIIILTVLLLKTNIFIGIAAIICVAFYVVLYLLSQKKYYYLQKLASAERSAFLSFVIGKMSNVLLIKLNSWQVAVKKELGNKGERYVKNAVKQLDFQNLINNLSTTWGRIFLLMLVGILFMISSGRNMDVLKIFTVSLLYIQQLLNCAKYVIQGGSMYQTYRVSVDRLQQMLGMPKESNGERTLDKVHCISLDKVSFSYGEKDVVKKISCKFTKGHSYAIVGGNGSGKTTLMLLLLGILRKQHGNIFWNNCAIEELDVEKLRKNNIGFVNQEPMLIEDTIYNNLFYGQEEKRKSVEELEEYVFLDFIKEMPQGFETLINSQSNNLSGGQKQRIAIVRALLRNSDILIFDEPTSALDEEGTKQFVELLEKEKEKRIIFVVTHDEAVVQMCDEKIVM